MLLLAGQIDLEKEKKMKESKKERIERMKKEMLELGVKIAPPVKKIESAKIEKVRMSKKIAQMKQEMLDWT